MKTVRVSGTTCAEEFNLRSAIIAYASTHIPVAGAISATHKDQLAASDVKWSHGRHDSTIVTAAVNGRIVVYDVNRTGVELARLHEHNRQVHKLAFNPFEGALLLSGSQDTTVKLWDLRAFSGDRSVMTCRSSHRYIGNNQGVRDLKWSPTDAVEFATGTDNGVVQRWDMRKSNAPLLKIHAHEKTCLSIDWHPDGIHLASASADKNVKVWDFTSTDRRLKPSWEFRAPQAVCNVRWRPPCWSAETHSHGSWQCTHLATSYDQRDPRVHLWDFRRPNIPFREFDRYNSAPTDLLWHSQELLWTVGNEGMFTQTDIHFAPKALERRALNALDWSSDGDVFSFSQERPQRRSSGIEDAAAEFLSHSKGKSSSGEKLSGSQSVTDGSLEEGFLSSSLRKRHSKTSSTRSSKSLGGTPPSANNSMKVINLDNTLEEGGVYKPSPAMMWVHIVGIFDLEAFCYLAKEYTTLGEAPKTYVSSYRLGQILRKICDENAGHAYFAGHYRLSQSWRILGLAVEKQLEIRDSKSILSGEEDQATQKRCQSTFSREQHQRTMPVTNAEAFEEHKFKPLNEPDHIPSVAPLIVESTSNMTTPLAKPMSGLPVPRDLSLDLYDLDEDASQAEDQKPSRVPPSTRVFQSGTDAMAYSVRHGSSHDLDDIVLDEQNALGAEESMEWRDKFQEERRAAMESYKPMPRPLLRLDDPGHTGVDMDDKHLSRHDSNESFQMFSTSTDSSHRARSMASSFACSGNLGSLGSVSERWSEQYLHQTRTKSDHDRATAEGDHESQDQIRTIPAKKRTAQTKESKYHDDSDISVFSVEDGSSQTDLGSTIRQSHSDFSVKLIVDGRPTHPGVLSQGHPFIPVTPESNNLNEFSMPSESQVQMKGLACTATTLDPPWTATKMLPHLVNYHTQNLSDVQMPAHLHFLLQADLEPMIGVQFMVKYQAEALLTAYHAQLYSLGQYVTAAKVRKISGRTSMDLTEQGMTEMNVRLWCRQCEKPLEKRRTNRARTTNQWVCGRCETLQAPCAVCWGRKGSLTPVNSIPTPMDGMFGEWQMKRLGRGAQALWSSCITCGHGGHDGCLQAWFEDRDSSEGGCPVEGCLHDCVPGIRRDQKLRRIAEEKSRRKRGLAKRDPWVAGESKAVEKARGALQAGILGEGGGGICSDADAGLLSGVFGIGAGIVKRVRLVAPDEQQQEAFEERRPSEARPIPQRSRLSNGGSSGYSAD